MSIQDWIKRIYDRVTADDESESKAKGYLSTRAEWHSAAWGLSAGFISAVLLQFWILIAAIGWMFSRASDRKAPDYIPYPKQFLKESLYVIAHVVVGLIGGTSFRIAIEIVLL